MATEFFFSDHQWAAIEPLLPTNQLGARRVDDRRVLSGVVHVLKTGCRWQDTPAIYVPRPLSTIASIDGRSAASGRTYLQRW